MFRSQLFITALLGLAVSYMCNADDGCVGWDDKIEDLLFSSLRDEINNSTSGFIQFPAMDFKTGFGMKFQNGSLRNLTSFDIVHLPGAQGNASYVCQSADGTNVTFALDVGFSDLEFTMSNFVMTLPLLPDIGNTKTVLKNSGNAVSVSVSILTQTDCTVDLNYIYIRELGESSVEFEHGFFNSIYQFIFNHLFGIISMIMGHFGIIEDFNESLQQHASTMISKQGSKICDLNPYGG